MDVVSTLKSIAQRERELLFNPPDYKLIEEQAAEQIEEMNNIIESVKSWYYIQRTDNANLVELAKILKI